MFEATRTVCGTTANESCPNIFLRAMRKVNKIETKSENFKVEIYVASSSCTFLYLKVYILEKYCLKLGTLFLSKQKAQKRKNQTNKQKNQTNKKQQQKRGLLL